MSRPIDQIRPDLYTRVTNAIVADLERGVRPWTKPWSAEHLAGRITRPLRHNGEPYNGINVILLWSEAVARGFTASTWMTFRQALALGGHVTKGEHGANVVYANRITRTEAGENGQDVEREIPYLKAYTVFNVGQVEGLPSAFHAPPEPPLDVSQRIDHADQFFAATGAEVRHGGDRAYYALAPDYVQMPPFKCFRDPESYYATLAHETTHWTRHPTRLDRISAVPVGATKAMLARSWSPSLAPPSSAPTCVWSWSPGLIMPATSKAGSRR